MNLGMVHNDKTVVDSFRDFTAKFQREIGDFLEFSKGEKKIKLEGKLLNFFVERKCILYKLR